MSLSDVPGPDGLPVIGQARQMMNDILGLHERLQEEYGDIVHFRAMGSEFCSVTDPAVIRQILIGDSDAYVKGDLPRKQLGGVLGDGIFLAEGEQWRRQRKHVQPVFFRERLDTYAPAIREQSERLSDRLDDSEYIDVEASMMETTLRILGQTLFGTQIEEAAVVHEVTPAILNRFDTTRVHAYLPDSAPVPAIRRYRRGLDRVHAFLDDLMRRRRTLPPDERGDDLLSILTGLVDAGVLSETEARDNLVTFLFAGHETSAHGLTFALCELAANPEIQTAVAEEIAAEVSGESPSAAELRYLDSLERVIDEALRLYPPAYLTFRQPTRDVELSGYTIPAGTTLSLPQWVVHRDSRWWDDPESYRPERFADGDPDRPEYAYFPFGGGPRHCIAMRFARMEMKSVVATLLSGFELEFAGSPEFDVEAASNLRLAEPVHLGVRDRT